MISYWFRFKFRNKTIMKSWYFVQSYFVHQRQMYMSKQLNCVRANLYIPVVISVCVWSTTELIPLSICVAQESHSRSSAQPRRRRVRNSVLKVYRPHGRIGQASRLRVRAGIPLRGSWGIRNSVVTYVRVRHSLRIFPFLTLHPARSYNVLPPVVLRSVNPIFWLPPMEIETLWHRTPPRVLGNIFEFYSPMLREKCR